MLRILHSKPDLLYSKVTNSANLLFFSLKSQGMDDWLKHLYNWEVMLKKEFLGQSLSYKRTRVASNQMTLQLKHSLLTALYKSHQEKVCLSSLSPNGRS